MKKIVVIVNLEFKEGEEPGQFLKMGIEIPKDVEKIKKDLFIQKAIVKRLRWTVEKED